MKAAGNLSGWKMLRYWAEDFFRGRILVAQAFRVTRDSDLDIDEEGVRICLSKWKNR